MTEATRKTRAIDTVEDVIDDLRATEDRGMMPMQRKTAQKYAERLTELVDDNGTLSSSDADTAIQEMRKTESHGMMPAQRETAGKYADLLEQITGDSDE